jgi:hypothetical protein
MPGFLRGPVEGAGFNGFDCLGLTQDRCEMPAFDILAQHILNVVVCPDNAFVQIHQQSRNRHRVQKIRDQFVGHTSAPLLALLFALPHHPASGL